MTQTQKALRTVLLMGVGLGLATSVFAQAALTQTRLSVRISELNQTTFTVSSGTGFAEGYLVYIDGEAMMTRAVSSTTITVTRGYAGTNAQTHLTGSIVWTGPAHYFYFVDPVPGNCRRTTQLVMPWINTLNGNVWYCANEFGNALGGYWHAVNSTPKLASMPKTIIPQFASGLVVFYTARMDDVYIASSTYTGQLEVFLPAATGMLGKVYIVSDEAGLAQGSPGGRTITVRGVINNGNNATISTAYDLMRLVGGVTASSNYVWFKW